MQAALFSWASNQSLSIGLTLLGVGLLMALQGFRFSRILLAVICGAGGFVSGDVVGGVLGEGGLLIGGTAALIFGGIALARPRIGLALASLFTFGALAQWLSFRLGIPANIAGFSMVLGGALGFSMFWLCRRTLPLIVTTLQGAGLLVVGFVATTSSLMPNLGETFVDWSSDVPLTVPVLMVMLCITGISVQANGQQGDMQTGSGRGWNSELIA